MKCSFNLRSQTIVRKKDVLTFDNIKDNIIFIFHIQYTFLINKSRNNASFDLTNKEKKISMI